jgi:hypothetical protein
MKPLIRSNRDPRTFGGPASKANGGYEELWENEIYLVGLRPCSIARHAATHVCIVRHDRSELAHNWSDMQAIKNQLCGEDREAVELFPAEARCVDHTNAYHLWVLKEGIFDLGFSCDERGKDEING